MKKIRPLHLAALMGIVAAFFIFEAVCCKQLAYHFPFVGYGGTFQNHNLTVAGIPVYWFLMLCGFVMTLTVSWYRRTQYQLGILATIAFPVIFLIASYAGAKVLYMFENYFLFRKISFELNGLSLYGAIYLILLMIPLVALCTKKHIPAMYDFFTPFGLILLACVRTGCFLNGCCGAITIWNGAIPIILPVQLMEVVIDLLILELCFWVEKKYPFQGWMYPLFMLSYSVCRFFLEFLRKTPKDFLNLSHGQIFSLIAIGLSLVMLAVLRLSKIEKAKT